MEGNTDARGLIGQRALINLTDGFRGSKVEEVRVLEVSPKGAWTKVMNMDGRKSWRPTGTLSVVELLTALPSERERRPRGTVGLSADARGVWTLSRVKPGTGIAWESMQWDGTFGGDDGEARFMMASHARAFADGHGYAVEEA